MSLVRIVWLSFFVLALTSIAQAQEEDCELTLAHATEEFQAGHFYSIPSIVSKCLNKFTSEQKQRANLLLTQTYLLLDDPLGAKRSFLEVLRANPEFVADPNIHSIDVVYLSKKFTSTAIFSWFAKAGPNLSPTRVIRDNDVFGQANASEKYRLRLGYDISAGADFYLSEKIALRSELNYSFSTYEHNTTHFFEEDRKTIRDKQTWLSVPLVVMYRKDQGKYRPYGYAGYSFGYLMRDIMNITIENIRTAEVGQDEKQSPDLNFISKRNRFNQSVVVGGGVKLKVGLDFLFADLRYSFGMKNIVNPANLLTDNTLQPTTRGFVESGQPAFAYAHVDDFFRLDNLSLSVGFLRPLYKPRELKKSRSASLSRKIKAGK